MIGTWFYKIFSHFFPFCNKFLRNKNRKVLSSFIKSLSALKMNVFKVLMNKFSGNVDVNTDALKGFLTGTLFLKNRLSICLSRILRTPFFIC